MKVDTKKPKLEMKDGVLSIEAGIGVDNDGDGEQSAGAEIKVFVSAKEAVAEIFKDGLPDWAKKLFGMTEQQALVAEANIQQELESKAQV